MEAVIMDISDGPQFFSVESPIQVTDCRDALQETFSKIEKQITEICSQSSWFGRKSTPNDKEVRTFKAKLSRVNQTLDDCVDENASLPTATIPLEPAFVMYTEKDSTCQYRTCVSS